MMELKTGIYTKNINKEIVASHRGGKKERERLYYSFLFVWSKKNLWMEFVSAGSKVFTESTNFFIAQR
jgi:hypothetical protein